MSGARSLITSMAFRCPPELLLRNAIRRCGTVASEVSGETTYRAAMCTELSKPLVMQNVSRKPLSYGMVRVAVHNAGINFADILQTQGKYQDKRPLPFVPGAEISGRVIEVGEGVEHLKEGDRVAGMCPGGSFAEETTGPAVVLSKVPDNVSYPAACALSCTYGTAWMALVHKAKIQQGETVLVTAAAGGVGSALVDIAVNVYNCTVIAACGGDEKCALMKRRGAQHVIDYRKEDMRERVMEITDGKGVDIICDNVGGQDEFRQLLRCISWEGRIVVIGFAGGTIPKIPANLIMLKSISVMGVFWGNNMMRNPPLFKKSLEEVFRYCSEGKVSPHICETFPLDKANDAVKFILDRKSTGKVVLSAR